MAQPVEIPTNVLYRSVSERPTEARFRLGDRQITVEGEELSVEIPLSEIFDARVGPPPKAANGFFGGSILTIGFDRDDEREVLFADGDGETIEKVGGLLYRRILDGTEVAVRHPAEVGGRVTGESYDIGTLQVTPGKVGCMGIEVPCILDLDSVVDFSRSTEELLGREQTTITITYVKNGVAVSLDLSMNPPRKQHLLARYLRGEYDEIRREVGRLDVPEPALRALVKLYSLRGTAKPQSLLVGESVSTASVLRGLAKHELVRVTEERVELTPRGWILVTEHVGDNGSTSRGGQASRSGLRT